MPRCIECGKEPALYEDVDTHEPLCALHADVVMQPIADSRVHNGTDLLSLTMVPDKKDYDSTLAADVLQKQSQLELTVIEQEAIAASQRWLKANIVASIDSAAAMLRGHAMSWYTLGKHFQLSERDSVNLRSTIEEYDTILIVLVRAIYNERMEQSDEFSPDPKTRRANAEKQTQTQLDAFTAANKRLADILSEETDEPIHTGFENRVACVVEMVQQRAEGVTNSSSEPLRRYAETAQACVRQAYEFGETIDVVFGNV